MRLNYYKLKIGITVFILVVGSISTVTISAFLYT